MLSSPNIKKILTLSPHADDMEIGCGGTVAKLLEQGKDVYSLVLSMRRKASPEEYSISDLYEETYKAHDTLGVPRQNLIATDFEHRVYPNIRQEILDYLVQINKFVKPDLVFIPSFEDMHQDHKTVSEEAFRAFKDCNILAYELPWNRIATTIHLYNIIEERHLQKKIESFQLYKSQITRHRVFFESEYIRGLAITRGGAIKDKYAEAFEVVRLINR